MRKLTVYEELGIELDEILKGNKDKAEILDCFLEGKYKKYEHISNTSLTWFCKILLHGYTY